MSFLPSGYTVCMGITVASYSYIDTGVVPSSTMGVDALFSAGDGTYVFGARNTNSNSSAGQLNIYVENNAQSYIGYAGARHQLGTDFLNLNNTDSLMHFHSQGNELEAVNGNYKVVNIEGATTTFTGTRNIYLGCLNNGGTAMESYSSRLHGFVIYDADGNITHDFVPCYSENDSKFGVYDLTMDNFIAETGSANRDLYLANIDHSVGGAAYMKTYHGENVDKGYCASFYKTCWARVNAIPDQGYSFMRWEDSNGNILSTEAEFDYRVTSAVTLKAIFVKKTELQQKTGFKCMAIAYGKNDMEASLRDDMFAEVLSATIKDDSLQKSTSTIIVKDLPSGYVPNIPIVLFDPKGQIIFMGMIQSIEDNQIVAREMLSFYDMDFLLHDNSSLDGLDLTNKSVLYATYYMMQTAKRYNCDQTNFSWNPLQERKFYPLYIMMNRQTALFERNVLNATTPIHANVEVTNLEEYLFSLFRDFGLYLKPSLMNDQRSTNYENRHYIRLKTMYAKELNPIVLSDNVETITNVSLTLENSQNTVLVIYNAEGTGLRGIIGVRTDGTTKFFNRDTTGSLLLPFLGYNNYIVKVVSQGGNINSIIAQNLSSAMYNHKITFTMSLDGSLLGFDSLKIGQPVNFYYKNKVYESIVTAIGYSVNENDDEIHSLDITLGSVRNNLTSKLNLGKVK